MRSTKSSSLVVCLALAACPGSDPMTTSASSTESGSTTDASGSSTVASGDPTTGTSATPTTTDAPTTGEPGTTGETTGGGPGAVTRVVYYTYVDVMGQPRADAMRVVEIVDGVASPPSTILDAPGTLSTFDATHDRRWSALYTGGLDPAQLWLIDMVSLVPHEIALPQEIERVLTVWPSRDDAYLIVLGGPQVNVTDEDYHYYVCEIGAEGDCALQIVEPATGPTTYVTSIHEISGRSGRIWYSTQEIGGTAVTVLQGDVAAPEAAATLSTSADGSSDVNRVSLDEATLYYSVGDGEYHAMDISVDPPGPLVPIYPPLVGTVRRTWADDETQLLVWNGDGLFGDLHRIAVDGAVAGAMQAVNSGAPGHVFAKGIKWTADGAGVLFLSDHETPMDPQIYLAAAAAPEPAPVKVSGPLEAGGSAQEAHVGGDPNHVIYFAQTNDMTPSEIYRARLDPPGEIRKLNAPLPDGAFLLSGAFDVSADGARVVYAGEEVLGRTDLFLVDIEGEEPAPAVNVTSALPADVEVSLLGHLGPDAAQVFFDGRGPDNARRGLYMVPLSPAVAPPVQISADGEAIYSYHILPPL